MSRLLGKPLTLGFGIALTVLLLNAVASAFNIRALVRGGRSVIHSREVIDGLDAALSAFRDAEAGQRGYLLTGDAEQLGSFQKNVHNINQRLDALKQLTPDDGRVAQLRQLMTERLALLRQAAEVRKQRGLEAAVAAVAFGPDRSASEAVRTLAEEMKNEEEDQFASAPPTPTPSCGTRSAPWPLLPCSAWVCSARPITSSVAVSTGCATRRNAAGCCWNRPARESTVSTTAASAPLPIRPVPACSAARAPPS